MNPEEFEILQIKPDDLHKLGFKLRFGAVDVRVVHLQAAHAHEAHQRPVVFVAVTGTVFGKSEGQVAVRAGPGGVNLVMKRAVHRFEVVLDVVKFHRGEHVAFVVRQVAGF